LSGISAVIVRTRDLAELARQAAFYASDFSFALAGDESQTVHPSGFDFGVTQDLLYGRLQTNPQRYTLLGQRRCPERLAQLIDDSWELYGHFLQKRSSLPKRKLASTDDHRTPGGTLLRWKLSALPEFSAALAELGGYPDLAIVDLDSRLTELTGIVSNEVQSIASRLTYVPATIKGLDRETIIVVGLAEVLRKMEMASRGLSAKGGDLVALDNRNRIDEIRVALSRSTHTLLLLEEPDVILDSALMGLGEIPTASWQDVQRYLRAMKRRSSSGQ
jgi:hypothetical protein